MGRTWGDPVSSGAAGFVRFGISHRSRWQKGGICGEDLRATSVRLSASRGNLSFPVSISMAWPLRAALPDLLF